MMTIASALTAMNTDIQNARTAITTKGGTVTSGGGSSQLATDIATIPTGGSAPVITSLNVTPTTSSQTITAPSGTDGYSPVNVAAVTAAIDSDIKASNIKSGVSILGVTGTVTELNGETRTETLTSSAGNTFTPSSGKNAITSITVTPNNQARSVTPSTSSQTLNVNSGYSGNGTISVSAVTSSIDANITAGNIKKDVTILGVTGTYEGGGGTESTGLKANYVLTSSNGIDYDIAKISSGSNILDPKATTVSANTFLKNAYLNNANVIEVSLPLLTTVSGQNSFENFNSGCTGLTDIDLSSLEVISGSQAFFACFYGCTGLTDISFPVLRDISGSQAMRFCFYGCTGLTDISFPALTTLSFGQNNNQFQLMLYGTGTSTTHTLHFPSNLQSIISGLSGYPLFGGSSGYVTIAFDLPATS